MYPGLILHFFCYMHAGRYALADEVLCGLDAPQVLCSIQGQLWLHTLDTYNIEPRLLQERRIPLGELQFPQ